MTITEGCLPHVTKPYGSFTARVHEHIAVMWVKLCCRDHLRQLLHVGGFDIYYVKGLQERKEAVSAKKAYINFSYTYWKVMSSNKSKKYRGIELMALDKGAVVWT